MRRKSYYICTIDRTLFTVSINAPVISDDMTPTERERYLPVDFAHQTDRDILRERIGDYHVQSITYGRRYQTEVELTYTNENTYQKIAGSIQANIGIGALSVSAMVSVDLESESKEEDFSMVLASEAFGFLEEEPLFLPSATDSEGRTVEQQVEDMITRNLNAFNQVDLNSNLQAQTGLNKITLFQELGDAYPLSYTVAPNDRYYSTLIPLTPLEEQRLVKHVDVAYNIKRELQDLEITIEQRAERLFQNYQLLSGATELSIVFLQVRQQITDEILELHAEVDEYLEQTPHQLAEKDVYRWAFDSSDKKLQHTSLDVFATEVYQLMGMDDAPMEEDANPVGATCLFNGIQATLDRGLETERQQKFAGRIIFGDMTVRHVLFDMNGKVVSLGFIDHTYEEYRPEYIDCPDEVGEACHELVFVREDCTLLKTGDKVWFAEGRYVIDKIGSDEHIAQGYVVKEKLTNIRIKLKSEDVDRDTIVVLTDEHIGDVTLRGFQNSYDLTQDLAYRLMFSYGYVCDSGGFSATEAKMVCTHLGYANLRDFQTGQEIPSSNAWGRPFVTLWDLQCSEYAMDLSECDYKTGELSDGDWERCGSRDGIFILCSDEHLEEDDVKITIRTMSSQGCVLQNWEGKREPEEICNGDSDQLDAVTNVQIQGDVCLMMYQGGDVRCVIRGENGENYDMTQATVRDRWCYESFDSESFPAELELVSQYPNGKGCSDMEANLAELKEIEVDTCAEGEALGLCSEDYRSNTSQSSSEEAFRSELETFRNLCVQTCNICPEVVNEQYYTINVIAEESSILLHNYEDPIPVQVTLLVDNLVVGTKTFGGAEFHSFGDHTCGSKVELIFIPEDLYDHGNVACEARGVRGIRMENNFGFVSGEVDVTFSCRFPPSASPSRTPSVNPSTSPSFSPTISPTTNTPSISPTTGVDRNGEECWNAGGCAGDTGGICEWCGTHDGEFQICCNGRDDYTANHPNCDGAEYSSTISSHQCVVLPSAGCVRIYVDAEFSGAMVTLGIGEHNVNSLGDVGNDGASSMIVGDQCKITLFSDADFAGNQAVFIPGSYDVDSFISTIGNDMLSSCIIESYTGSLIDVGSDGCSTDSPCGECEGDCDRDADCDAGLQCFMRDTSDELVPHCSAGGPGDIPTHDYCYLPGRPLIDLGGEGCTAESPCRECEGDCDSDADCNDGLRCSMRSTSHKSIPGCWSGGSGDIPTHDYCYLPA